MISYIGAVRLVGVTYILAVAFWFTLEGSAALSYWPRYSWKANMISELGVPYMYVGGVHLLDYSPLSWLMNLNFFGTACLYAFPQWLLLFVTHGEEKVDEHIRTVRAVLSGLFLIGLILVGVVHGGPREHKDGTIIEHEFGASLTILGGNICSILAGVTGGQIKPVLMDLPYRATCVILGILGLAFVTALVTITPPSQQGAVERLSVYTIFAWQLLTGISLLRAPKGNLAKVKTG